MRAADGRWARGITGGVPRHEQVASGPGRFLGELNLLTGQSAIATSRVRAPGIVHRIVPAQFRELMAADAEVSDLVQRVLLARRQSLAREPCSCLPLLRFGVGRAGFRLRVWAEF